MVQTQCSVLFVLFALFALFVLFVLLFRLCCVLVLVLYLATRFSVSG